MAKIKTVIIFTSRPASWKNVSDLISNAISTYLPIYRRIKAVRFSNGIYGYYLSVGFPDTWVSEPLHTRLYMTWRAQAGFYGIAYKGANISG